jgi:hypothetical protein
MEWANMIPEEEDFPDTPIKKNNKIQFINILNSPSKSPQKNKMTKQDETKLIDNNIKVNLVKEINKSIVKTIEERGKKTIQVIAQNLETWKSQRLEPANLKSKERENQTKNSILNKIEKIEKLTNKSNIIQ